MKPNILIIHCHDLGDHIGCYPGNSAITPTLDRLATEGVVFERHFAASPTCSPSRGALFSGLAPCRNGLMALASGGHWVLDPKTPTFPRLLADAGYTTAHFGSWHVHPEFSPFGIDVADPEDECEAATEHALDFLRSRPSRPFYLFVGFQQPHREYTSKWPELQPPADIVVPAYLPDDPGVRDDLVRLYGDVTRVDACVAPLLDFLRSSDLERETLVIFTTDHGIGMPLAKGTLYDPGLRIALVFRWPGRIAAGRRCGGLTVNTDILPTILDAAGESVRMPQELDGQSLWPFLADNRDVSHDHVFAEQTWHDFYEPIRSIRTERHKLIRNFQPGCGLQIAADILYTRTAAAMTDQLVDFPRPEFEFYDLDTDPVERRNLAGLPGQAAIERELRGLLQERLETTNDPILNGPIPAPPGYWEHFLAKPQGPGGLPLGSHNGPQAIGKVRDPSTDS